MNSAVDLDMVSPPKIVVDNRGNPLPKLVKAATAVRKLEYFLGTSVEIKAMLADKLRQGEIHAYAFRTWTSSATLELVAVWKTAPPERALQKAKINRNVLKGSENWLQTVDRWDWRKGNFFVPIAKNNKVKYYQDVRFVADDIDNIRSAAEKAWAYKKGAGGRKFNEDAWTKIWLEVVALAAAGKLTKNEFAQKQQLVEKVIQSLGRDEKAPLAANTVTNALSKAYDRFIEPDNGEQFPDPSQANPQV